MKPAMKAAMKPAMKAAMKTSKVASGKLAKAMVLKGSKEKTVGGLTKSSIIKNKAGKAVSKKMSTRAKTAFKGSALEKWIKACQAARKAMNITGFAVVGGSTPQG